MVIAQKIEYKRLRDQIISITNLISSIQFHALMYFEFLTRGDITIGELSIDSTVVWGTGLIEAYSIENRLAIYPRIVVSRKLLNEYESHIQESLNLYAFIKEDFDGLWFIDFLLAVPNLKIIPKTAEILQEFTMSYIKEPDDKIKQKINWLIAYHNAHCCKFRNRGGYDKYVLPFI
jgi:hypothetical protein